MLLPLSTLPTILAIFTALPTSTYAETVVNVNHDQTNISPDDRFVDIDVLKNDKSTPKLELVVNAITENPNFGKCDVIPGIPGDLVRYTRQSNAFLSDMIKVNCTYEACTVPPPNRNEASVCNRADIEIEVNTLTPSVDAMKDTFTISLQEVDGQSEILRVLINDLTNPPDKQLVIYEITKQPPTNMGQCTIAGNRTSIRFAPGSQTRTGDVIQCTYKACQTAVPNFVLAGKVCDEAVVEISLTDGKGPIARPDFYDTDFNGAVFLLVLENDEARPASQGPLVVDAVFGREDGAFLENIQYFPEELLDLAAGEVFDTTIATTGGIGNRRLQTIATTFAGGTVQITGNNGRVRYTPPIGRTPDFDVFFYTARQQNGLISARTPVFLSLSPSLSPTLTPTIQPTISPTLSPSLSPTLSPSFSPTAPTLSPTLTPTREPSLNPTLLPTLSPTLTPTNPTLQPTKLPTEVPTLFPSVLPTKFPTVVPTQIPTLIPTETPTTEIPTFFPTISPTEPPSFTPTVSPAFAPTESPTGIPTLFEDDDETAPDDDKIDDTAPDDDKIDDTDETPTFFPTFFPTISPTDNREFRPPVVMPVGVRPPGYMMPVYMPSLENGQEPYQDPCDDWGWSSGLSHSGWGWGSRSSLSSSNSGGSKSGKSSKSKSNRGSSGSRRSRRYNNKRWGEEPKKNKWGGPCKPLSRWGDKNADWQKPSTWGDGKPSSWQNGWSEPRWPESSWSEPRWSNSGPKHFVKASGNALNDSSADDERT